MLTASIYYRFSTTSQERGSSKERQIEDCEALCHRNGWEIVEVFGDAGKSAWSGAHLNGGKLGGFAERVRSGEIGAGHVLVVEKLDRLSREEIVVARNWIEEMCGLGIQISTVQGHTLTKANVQTDIMVMLEMLFRAKLAKDESDQKSERVSAAMARNLEKAKTEGRILTSRCHGWLRVNKDRTGFDVIENRAETVRKIYQMSADGYGRLHIAKTLNSMGDDYRVWGKSKLAKQGKWNPVYIACRAACKRDPLSGVIGA
jgi:DNA invertase Pin-like site-specific DNA recombinase